ncbi:MAG: hypothetical protein KGQ47_17085, partial [Hyphomicrobiales bacterium]|nr:hypothetical protein [Hyphomicrobiales bacterium]
MGRIWDERNVDGLSLDERIYDPRTLDRCVSDARIVDGRISKACIVGWRSLERRFGNPWQTQRGRRRLWRPA